MQISNISNNYSSVSLFTLSAQVSSDESGKITRYKTSKEKSNINMNMQVLGIFWVRKCFPVARHVKSSNLRRSDTEKQDDSTVSYTLEKLSGGRSDHPLQDEAMSIVPAMMM